MPADGHEIETPCAFPPSFSAALPGISRAVCQIPLDAAAGLPPGARIPALDVCFPAPDACGPAPDACGPAPVQAAITSISGLITAVLTTAVVFTRRRAIVIKGPLFHRKSIPTLAQTGCVWCGDRKLTGYRAALDAGTSPATVVASGKANVYLVRSGSSWVLIDAGWGAPGRADQEQRLAHVLR